MIKARRDQDNVGTFSLKKNDRGFAAIFSYANEKKLRLGSARSSGQELQRRDILVGAVRGKTGKVMKRKNLKRLIRDGILQIENKKKREGPTPCP